MVIEKKIQKPVEVKEIVDEKEIERLIKQGGSAPQHVTNQVKKELVFNLRIPFDMVEEIDADRKSQGGFVSRNTWILQAIMEKIKRENNEG